MCRSPLSGAAIQTPNATSFQPGQSGNPAGQSLKVRARAALARVLDDPSLDAAIKRLSVIAAESEDDGHAVAAMRLVSDVTGLRDSDEDRRQVDVRIRFETRASGDAAELEVAKPDAAAEKGIEL